MRPKLYTVGVMIPVVVAMIGCFLLPHPPDTAPSIRGTITSITVGEDGFGSIMVEGPIADGTTYDKASVTVTKKTTVLMEGLDGWGRFSFAELSEGDTVNVWFTGAVAESYPVQATAKMVVLAP
jgi:hypothetical protein